MSQLLSYYKKKSIDNVYVLWTQKKCYKREFKDWNKYQWNWNQKIVRGFASEGIELLVGWEDTVHFHYFVLLFSLLYNPSYALFFVFYNVVLVSGVQQSESVIHIHISTVFYILFPYRPLEYWVEFPVLYIRSLLVICFIYCSVYMSIPISHFVPLPHLPPGNPSYALWVFKKTMWIFL